MASEVFSKFRLGLQSDFLDLVEVQRAIVLRYSVGGIATFLILYIYVCEGGLKCTLSVCLV